MYRRRIGDPDRISPPARVGLVGLGHMGGPMGANLLAHDLPNILCGNDDETFTLALCSKDLRLISKLAAELEVPAPLAALVRERFEAALERFGPAAGELAVARLVEEEAGVSIREHRA